MVSRRLFVVFVALLGVQRLWEMRLSQRNERWLRARGAQEFAPGQLTSMKVLHSAWLAAMVAEVVTLKRKVSPRLAAAAGLVFAAGQTLRYLAIRTLGRRWSVRVIAAPGLPPVEHGIYRYIRHPNYLGVALEIVSAPSLHGAYLTAALFSALNALVLRERIRTEEQVLAQHPDYARRLQNAGRTVDITQTNPNYLQERLPAAKP